jgi:hypothetical protein
MNADLAGEMRLFQQVFAPYQPSNRHADAAIVVSRTMAITSTDAPALMWTQPASWGKSLAVRGQASG